MSRILALAAAELKIAARNRWVAIAVAMMAVFSLALAAAGSAPTGALGADRLSVIVASLTSLAVYLVPLVALLMSFDAVAGEVERGTLPLLLTYPVSRWQVLAGKFAAHLAILTLAVAIGYGLAAGAAWAVDRTSAAGLPALWRLGWTSVVLGGSFLGAGYLASAIARRPAGAAGLAIGVWLVAVVLYDLALLGLVVAEAGGEAVTRLLPAALLANPADAFRLFNLGAAQATAAAAGLGGAAAAIPPWQALLPLLAWPFATLALATAAFRRVTP